VTGVYPTVGLVVAVDSAPPQEVADRVRQALAGLIPPDSWSRTESSMFAGTALIGGARRGVILWSGQVGTSACVFLELDEEELARLARDSAQSILELLQPFVAAAQTCPGAFMVGAGFELALPSDLGETGLRDAGVAHLAAAVETSGEWIAKELRPFVGHYS
jgi:hypothetical protein